MTSTDRPENERVAFCQNCGRPLTADEARNVGSAIYCEPCLVAKVAAADVAGGARAGAGTAAGAGSYGFSGTSSGVNYNFQGTTPPPVPPGTPNPALAALLGFIPGVGAFYNGQYAKGVVHLVVFAVLATLADNSGIFALFVAGWIFYQVIEAHHTARARRDGTPLPNPFGLNDVGERLGFGKAWPAAAPVNTPGAHPPMPGDATYSGGVGAGPASGYGQPAAAYAPPAQPGYATYPPPAGGWGAPAESYGATPPPMSGVPMGAGLAGSPSGSRVPTGALILIGLGVVFLVANSGMFRGFPVYRLLPFLLIGIGVWVFVRKMTEKGLGLAEDGSAAYRLRLFQATRGSVWIVLVGVLFLLDTFHILSWGHSWPLFIIVGGLMTFFQRSAYATVISQQYAYPGTAAPVTAPPTVNTPPSTSIVPTSVHDREGN